ncbi:MAG: acyltransferase family protein [Candidatus Latescibacterota bacterium]
MNTRLHYFDNLRSFAVMLVIFHHTAITYGASGGWYYREVSDESLTSILFTLLAAINQSFFMGLLFFISGYFTPPSYDRKGAPRFLKDKLIRLGIPLLFYVFVIGPLLGYFLYSRDETTLSRYYADRVLSLKEMHWGPLWFVEALLIFNFAYAAWRSFFRPGELARRYSFPSRRVMLIAAVLTGCLAFLLRLAWPVGSEVLGMQLGYFVSYVLLFILGILAYRSGWLENIPRETVRAWTRTAIVAIFFLPVFFLLGTRSGDPASFEGGFSAQALSYALWEPFVAFGIILFLLSLFQQRLNRTSPLLRGVSESSYTAYIIHPPVVVGISLLISGISAPPALKFLAVGVTGITACFTLSWLITRIPGAKKVL